jgi:hypothetical protein
MPLVKLKWFIGFHHKTKIFRGFAMLLSTSLKHVSYNEWYSAVSTKQVCPIAVLVLLMAWSKKLCKWGSLHWQDICISYAKSAVSSLIKGWTNTQADG